MYLGSLGGKNIFVIKRAVLVESTICLRFFVLSLPCHVFFWYSALFYPVDVWLGMWVALAGECERAWHTAHPSRSFKCARMHCLCLYQPLAFYLSYGKLVPWLMDVPHLPTGMRSPWNATECRGEAWHSHSPVSDILERKYVFILGSKQLKFGVVCHCSKSWLLQRIIKWEEKSYTRQEKKILCKSARLCKKPKSCWNLTFIMCNYWTSKGRKPKKKKIKMRISLIFTSQIEA